jgi:hypothetical protein
MSSQQPAVGTTIPVIIAIAEVLPVTKTAFACATATDGASPSKRFAVMKSSGSGSGSLRQSNPRRQNMSSLAFTVRHVALHVPFSVNLKCSPQCIGAEPPLGALDGYGGLGVRVVRHAELSNASRNPTITAKGNGASRESSQSPLGSCRELQFVTFF